MTGQHLARRCPYASQDASRYRTRPSPCSACPRAARRDRAHQGSNELRSFLSGLPNIPDCLPWPLHKSGSPVRARDVLPSPPRRRRRKLPFRRSGGAAESRAPALKSTRSRRRAKVDPFARPSCVNCARRSGDGPFKNTGTLSALDAACQSVVTGQAAASWFPQTQPDYRSSTKLPRLADSAELETCRNWR